MVPIGSLLKRVVKRGMMGQLKPFEVLILGSPSLTHVHMSYLSYYGMKKERASMLRALPDLQPDPMGGREPARGMEASRPACQAGRR